MHIKNAKGAHFFHGNNDHAKVPQCFIKFNFKFKFYYTFC